MYNLFVLFNNSCNEYVISDDITLIRFMFKHIFYCIINIIDIAPCIIIHNS